MPILSIIIPAYNVEKYIDRCLQSIIDQTFGDFEVIVVNDGSTDTTAQIVEKFSERDSRFILVNQINRGVSAARNHGMELAKGKFITFIDSDDFVDPIFLSNFSYCESIDLEIQGYTMIFADGSEPNRSIVPQKTAITSIREAYEESELNRLSRSPICKLFKSDIIKKYNIVFPVNLSYGEDAIFVKRYLLRCESSARTISEAHYNYLINQNPTSLTQKPQPPKGMYDLTLSDLDLFEQLMIKLGEISQKAKNDFYRVRALEYYWFVLQLAKSEKINEGDKMRLFKDGIKNIFNRVKDVAPLPITYVFIKFIIEHLPPAIALKLISLR